MEKAGTDIKNTQAYKEYKAIVSAEKRDIINVEHVVIKDGPPNSITQVVKGKGYVDRNYYDAQGYQIKQISNNNHGNPKLHPYGKKGEHAHDYIWKDGKLVGRPARELSDEERKENEDIL